MSRHTQIKRMSNLSFHPSLFLFVFFIFFASSSSSFLNNTRRCSNEQGLALLQFKQNLFSFNVTSYDYPCQHWLGSGYYPIMMNWNMSTNCCTWDGVTCNRFTGDVIGLDLSCGMLRGTIHPNTTLFHLPHLQRLDLSYNNFSDSSLPREIGRFANSLTHLKLSMSGFGGEIPLEISLLPKLVSLDLSGNEFDFGIETLVNILQNSTFLKGLWLYGVNIYSVLPAYLNISSSLNLLDLDNTGLRGKLPENIFNLPYLENLELSYNDLIGPLPKVNISIDSRLKSLGLSKTRLSGEIPNSIGSLKSLNTLQLRNCSLTGPIPRKLINLRHLKYLDLSNNMLNGTLPSSLFTLPSLEIISLSYNKFTGNIDVLDQGPTPQSFQQLTNLSGLDLSFNNFTGVWDLDTLLSRLTSLQFLDLSYSGLSVVTNNVHHYVNPDFYVLGLASCKLNVFPESLRAMKNLTELDLSNNQIRGRIPDWAREVGGIQLYYLNLSRNFITSMPQFQWYGLSYLHLQSNMIQGPFPPAICNMSLLQRLDLSNNNLGGVIPQCFGDLVSQLSMVDLSNNRLHGTIPKLFKDCIYLQGLVLNGNQLEGEIPSSLNKCQSLRVLDLGNNQLNGKLPNWLGALPLLQVLVLKSNNLHGRIKSSFTIKHPFPSLRVLGLSHNRLVGRLPGIYFQNFKAMKNVVMKGTKPEYVSFGIGYYSIVVVVKGAELSFLKILVDYIIIDLSHNRFEMEIPDVIGDLNSLIALNLSHNSLTGEIPNALGNLKELESLDLSWNKLTGQIPQSLADIKTLEALDLSQNRFVGRIPPGTQFNTFGETSSFGGNPQLCGFPLLIKCEHPKEPQLEAVGDTNSNFTWKVVVLGYGCGTVIGLAMGYLMLSTRRPKWFNAIADAGEDMIHTTGRNKRYIYIGK